MTFQKSSNFWANIYRTKILKLIKLTISFASHVSAYINICDAYKLDYITFRVFECNPLSTTFDAKNQRGCPTLGRTRRSSLGKCNANVKLWRSNKLYQPE